MSSVLYHLMLGLIGFLVCGSVYSILDQINMGNIYNLAVQMNLNGDYINIFVWFWAMIPIAATFAFIIGLWAQAHFARNEG